MGFATSGFVEDTMAEQPNDASRKSKAEGERGNESEPAGDYRPDEGGAGITNRSLDEEMENQGALPSRGESKPGAHAGHGDSDDDEFDGRRSER
jgi:hypothetical protein